MKRLALIIMAAAAFFSVSAKDIVSHNPSDLPQAARTVLKNNFKADISFIKIDKDFGRISDYEVVLTDGSEVKFDRSGNWEEVEASRNSSVPNNFVPQAIRDFVSKNHKGAKVVGISKDRKGYDVELSNGIEAKFNLQGQFKRYDD